jgi:cytochrome c553
MQHHVAQFLAVAFITGTITSVAAADSASAAPSADALLFESRVRPLLIDNCLSCHSEKKQKGGLRLDSLPAVLKGGKHGAEIVPGKPEESRLITAISYDDENLQMPPDNRLSDQQVKVLTEWVKQGAPWPAAVQLAAPAAPSKHRVIVDSDKAFWSFQPVKMPVLPEVKDEKWCSNPVDRFVLAKLEAEGLAPAAPAGRDELIRRATFDLIGLPPTPAEVEAFVNDPAPDAYEHLIDRLLASPRYGERWGRHWLDLVRFSESDGFKQDAYRPNAWPYRDYVIKSFNDDKPYAQFVTEQLAGDEVAPGDPNIVVATGFLRAGMYEYNQRDVPKQWNEMLIDVTDVTADAFLGLSMGCARCHDHKFDPILRTDYYRMQAFFAPMLPRNDLPLASAPDREAHASAMKAWEEKTADIRAQMEPMEKAAIESASRGAMKKFEPAMQAILKEPASRRTPQEEQWAQLALRQIFDGTENTEPKITGKNKEKYDVLKKQLAEFAAIRPKPLPRGFLMSDVGPVSPAVYVPGDVQHAQEPGFPVVLNGLPITQPPIVPTATSTGRRLALAKWITQPENPLTYRVLVNRLWQYHFGRGLVATSGDFGHLGTPPSHPELLDYLARQFIDNGGHMKAIHRLIMLSATYRQSSLRTAPEIARMKDPDNRWLWRMNTERLDAEQIRDAMLAVSGELNLHAGGPSADENSPRRSIYTKLQRNHPDPLLEAFDAPEAFGSVPVRNHTTTATQSLLMINGDWTLKRAAAMAARIKRDTKSAEPSALVDAAYRLAYGRAAHSDELDAAVDFLKRGGKIDTNFVDLCHVILNSSEFLYVD